MNLEIEIEGIDELIASLNKLENTLSTNGFLEYVAIKSIEIINGIAGAKLQQNSDYIAHNKYKFIDNGVMIYNDVQNLDGNYYSLIIEYGSGTASDSGDGPEEWFVHETQANLELYEYQQVYSKQGMFYKVHGQSGKHIYTDAFDKIYQNLDKWLTEYLKEGGL